MPSGQSPQHGSSQSAPTGPWESPAPSDNAFTFPDLSNEPPRLQPLPQSDDERYFAPEKKAMEMGALGGVLMMIIAAAWFVVGLMCDRIFLYPPILFVIGLFTLLYGIATGNLAGKKRPVKRAANSRPSQDVEFPWDSQTPTSP
jgi:hypothetical protein